MTEHIINLDQDQFEHNQKILAGWGQVSFLELVGVVEQGQHVKMQSPKGGEIVGKASITPYTEDFVFVTLRSIDAI